MMSHILLPYAQRSIDDYDDNFCSTPACMEIARSIKAKMNDSADYCDDFYNYVCGGFVNSTLIPDDKNSVSIATPLEDIVLKQLNTIISRPSQPDEPEIFKLAKSLYKICMDIDAIEEQGVKPLFDYVEQLGGWPVLKKDNEWNESLFNWKENIAQISKNKFWLTSFFRFYKTVDIKNNTRRVIGLSDYNARLARENLVKGLEDKSVINYFNYMVNMSVALGAEQEHAEEELKEALEFEIKLTNLTRPNEDYRDKNLAYNPMTLGDLAKKYPYFEWKKYLNHLLSPSNISVNDDEIIIVTKPGYFDKLDKLIDSTPKKIQANLVIWKEIRRLSRYLNENIRKVNVNYEKIKTGIIKITPRWMKCTHTVSSTFSIATNALYVREYFKKESKDNVAVMVKNIHNQFIKLLNSTSWLDEETRINAIKKAEKINQFVAYPDELLNNSIINDYHKAFENFEMIGDSYVESFLNLGFFVNKIGWSEFREKYVPNMWDSFAAMSSMVNAFYSPPENSIMLPAGILQGEFFNNELPKYMNYGAIGGVVGHEIMHAFDDQGKQFDAYGNVLNWWSNSTNEQYKKKAQCIIDQYGNYTIKEINLNINGINTQGENIADNGGIKAAYLAYNAWSNNNELEKKLPGFDFNHRQMFWISYANTWCAKTRRETQKLKLTTDTHSPSEFRVNGPLSNTEEFSTDFGCPIGSKMNPEKKCTIW
ncbi:neprilysin-2-like [Aphidius gifuensis]|uniref:neprilysin-2-like n=1 Tax=Aphidius gifuensis TaxID=684658 RepID=UPI001CDD5BE6|nr:neprilysin-2-like [Aphidius gifuensis]